MDALKVNVALIAKAHIEDLSGLRPLLLQHFPGIDVLFSGQVIPCHDAPERVVAVEQSHGHNIATILQDNALWLMLERNRAAIEIGDGERILRGKATERSGNQGSKDERTY